MTKTQARKIAQRSRRLGHLRISATEDHYWCPVHSDALRGDGMPHTVAVHHHPWETSTAPMVAAAFIEHLCSPDEDERCPALPAQPPG